MGWIIDALTADEKNSRMIKKNDDSLYPLPDPKFFEGGGRE